ncbi:hypothetical protein [Chitinophaga eiseniae]|uniref:YD repeat-containing protein n=1 Tax=Chitinophaga eiseniae TaxID=634771 RepID=A0A847SCI2_9BACT|nr:hypothetical protein [Chitinophaga eiseniae]NLR77453.1 hypothetical protein [Chitinophaga eiseniae]
MNKLILLVALCLLATNALAQELHENITKQDISILLLPNREKGLLRGPVKSYLQCITNYDGKGTPSNALTYQAFEFTLSGWPSKLMSYTSTDKSIPTVYYYTGNRIDSSDGPGRKIYLYNDDNSIRQIDTYGYMEGDRYTLQQSVQLFYDKRRLVNKSITTQRDQPETTTTYTYNKAGKLTGSHTTSTNQDMEWSREFEEKAQLLRFKTSYKNTPANNFMTTMELNKQGDISATTYSGNGKVYINTYQYEYDAKGNWIKQTRLMNGQMDYVARRSYQYYPEGNGQTGLATTAPDMPALPNLLLAAEVVDSFTAALNQRQYTHAWQYCTGKRWGTAAQFSSVKMYGGITAARLLKPLYQSIPGAERTINITATVAVDDPVNGNGIFEQEYQLQRGDNGWKIAGIRLISSSRASDNWSLQVAPVPDFNADQVMHLSKAVYDTVSLLADVGDHDSIVRSLDTLRFFKTDKKLYALAVFTNQGPQYGAATGWCDILLFSKNADKWRLQTFLLNAGGGGMYGYSGRFLKLLRTGDEQLGIVLEGGLTHMGENVSWVDVVGLQRDQLSPLTHLVTSYEYDNGSDSRRCYDNKFRFEKNGRPGYDLIVETASSCGVAPRRYIIPYSDGYKLPKALEQEL